MKTLAKEIIEFDERHPGDPEASIEIPAALWKRFVKLAKKKQSDVEEERHQCALLCELPASTAADDERPEIRIAGAALLDAANRIRARATPPPLCSQCGKSHSDCSCSEV